jgi:hypothetical protein
MPKCPTCETELESNHPALFLAKIADFVKGYSSWSTIEDYPEGHTLRLGDLSAKLVSKKVDPGYPANGYDGAWEQGTEFTAHLVLEVNDHFFMKTGTGDSYGDISWDGDLKQVTVKERVVKYYE